MTQNTQTTAERIARLIDENYQIHGLRADYETAKIVARELDARQAQIDALRAQLRTALAERDEAWAKAADWEHEEGLAEIADTQTNLHYAEVAKNRELTAQLRTANAEVARLMPLPEIYTLWKKIIEDGNPSRDTVAHFVELAHKAAERAATSPADLRTPTDQRIAALEALLAEARAEVERLRPAAEAWEAREALVAASKIRDAALWEIGAPNTDRYRVTKSAWLVAEEAAETAAARARAAKETP